MHTLTNRRQGCMHKTTQQFLRKGWRPTSMQNGWAGTDGSMLGWNRALWPVQGGREPLWEFSRDGQDERYSQDHENYKWKNIFLSSLAYKCEGYLSLSQKGRYISNTDFSQLNRITKNNPKKTYNTLSHLLKCTCLMYVLIVHLIKCTGFHHNLVIFYA